MIRRRVERASYGRPELLDGKGFFDNGFTAKLVAEARDIRVTGNEQNLQCGPAGTRLSGQFNARHVGHCEVHQQEISGRATLQQAQCRSTAFSSNDIITKLGQQDGGNIANVVVVVDQDNNRTALAGWVRSASVVA
jgi:hypothetical protein